MKRRCYTLLLLLFVVQLTDAQQQWAWMTGEKSVDLRGVYGDRGVANSSNHPGSRTGSVSWTDTDGNFWLFGGRGLGEGRNEGLLNDLWKFNPSSKIWTWVAGAKTINSPGNYGTKGSASTNNQPGARQGAVTWTDNNGNFWLFGGSGIGFEEDDNDRDNETGLLNDLWTYSVASGQWTWVSGSDLVDQTGKYGRLLDILDIFTSNFPGGRSFATGWKDASGNLWLFGGNGFSTRSQADELNDVWRYSLITNRWTWMAGDRGEAKEHYGRKGVFARNNTPGGRQGSTGWTDKQGNFWMFGGAERSNLFGDIWKYNPLINQWAWINGNRNSNTQGDAKNTETPGSRSLASGWVDNDGSLWLFGGNGYGGRPGINPLNNLWKYDVAKNQWQFAKGDMINPKPVYGSQGIAAAGNQPGGTGGAAQWKDREGNLWIFGGESADGRLNQTWKFFFNCSAVSGAITPASATICEGAAQTLTASGGDSYEWRRNDILIAGKNEATLSVTEIGTYSVVIKNGACSGPASNTAIVTRATTVNGSITPASAAICDGASQVLTATGGITYEWKRNDELIVGETKATLTVVKPGTYSVYIKNGSCSGPASNTSVITRATTTGGPITPASASICEGVAQTLTTSGGDAYVWLRNDVIVAGETKATLTVTQPGTYSAIIKNGSCSAAASNVSVVEMGSSAGSRYADVMATANVPIRLSARQIGVTYEWTPATGLDDPSSATPLLTTGTNVQYLVKITPAQGCLVVDTVQVNVNAGEQKPKKMYVPTAFTPNGNGANDILRPLPRELAVIHYFKVFNRWGNIVYYTNTIGAGWDGKFNGVPLSPDAYTWVLFATTLNGEQIRQSGKTQLIR